eukprot:CAMPEP_0118694582 /NCGR_PEP_ID=MMETSP0800-20121206/12617_1 /TAXON_ID=210618 ORGANISM="Striatella unipunctata, Strain CCMP2910" /NCGR_SAMPLE_ID=MMETSP0800 /ASSEMBLY_ACC=CAM_ASM_000638 /LENGTH=109 /DNA_ID=CAMNT_0006593091 /DNA_START=33 /DNA_END=362 /DNA_ORIENTATION=-
MAGYLHSINNEKVFGTTYTRVVGFRPTGWSHTSNNNSSSGKDNLVSSRGKGNDMCVYSVPYSEHSSFPELVDCIACLKPKKIIPTVNVRNSEEQVNKLKQAIAALGGSA